MSHVHFVINLGKARYCRGCGTMWMPRGDGRGYWELPRISLPSVAVAAQAAGGQG